MGLEQHPMCARPFRLETEQRDPVLLKDLLRKLRRTLLEACRTLLRLAFGGIQSELQFDFLLYLAHDL